MASRDSWIDRHELEELAGQLGASRRSHPLADATAAREQEAEGPIALLHGNPNPAFPDIAESDPSPEVIAQLDRKLAEIKDIAQRSGLLMKRTQRDPAEPPTAPAPLPTESPPPSEPPEIVRPRTGSLKNRLAAFRVWLTSIPQPMSAFIVNAVGDPLHGPTDEKTDARLIAAALALFEASQSRRVRKCARSGAVSVEIGDAGLLTVYSVPAWGSHYLLGVVTGLPIPPETGQLISKAFAAALMGTSST